MAEGSEVMGFAAPSRLVLEVGGCRFSAYVTNFETDCLWLLANQVPGHLGINDSVRMTVRDGDAPSLGLRGRLLWVSQDRLAVAVDHPFDRRIVAQWGQGLAADLEDYCRADSGQSSVDLEPLPTDALSETRPRDSNWYGITLEEYVEEL